MPRLDNGDLDALMYIHGIEKGRELWKLAKRDPGAVNPIDICAPCEIWLLLDLPGDVSHPPYEEQTPQYKCALCDEPLTAADNGYM